MSLMSAPGKGLRYGGERPPSIHLGGSDSRRPIYGRGMQLSRLNLRDFSENDQWFGEIKSVDIDRRVVRVRTYGTKTIDVICPWSTPYCHPEGGYEGYEAIPREGAQVVLSRIQGRYLVTDFVMPSAGAEAGGSEGGFVPNHAGFRSLKHQRGDQVIGSIDKNFLAVTSDGAIVLQSRSLTRLVLEPLRGFCRMFLRNWEAFVDGGFMKWITQNAEDGEPRCDFFQLWKDTPMNGLDNQVHLRVGKNGGQYELKIMKRVLPLLPLEQRFRLHIDEDGNLSVRASGNAFVKIEGNATLSVDGRCDIVSSSDMQIASGGNMRIIAVGQLTLQGNPIHENP